MLLVALFTTVMCFHMNAAAQQLARDDSVLYAEWFQIEDSPSFGYLVTYFPSIFIENGIELKSIVRSDIFKNIRERFGDIQAVDALYVQAMRLTKNNVAVSLILSTIACMDHRLVGINIPIFNLCFPLSNESEREFTLRVNNLPTRLYPDTPVRGVGDRDKLQHFFGSAFLSFIFESAQPAERFGEFIELGEGAFIVDGAIDDRDRRANRQGQDFGVALLQNDRLLPSQFLKFQIVLEQNEAK
ncbi:MAG TPA: hypothetical protein VFF29_01480 [Bacteroidota bacterium]|nr:hypothetical protein [Bacteroidota bacterium]